MSFPARGGAMVLVSEALARGLGCSVQQAGKAIREHLERFGEDYAKELPAGAKVVKLELAAGLAVVIMWTLTTEGGYPVAVIAAVLPSEQLAGERSLGALRRKLAALAKEGKFLPE